MKTGTIYDDLIGQVVRARMINSVCNAPIVAPWEVDELPDEWIDACMAYAEALSGN